MKEIGEKLKNAREEIGVSINEASTDLKISEEQLNNLENGNMDTFKDIVNVKYLIRDYAKYLGLNKENLVDDFNEYLFDYTSKISIEDIKDMKAKKEDKKIKSPYTTIKQKKIINVPILIAVIVLLLSIFSITYYEINKKRRANIIAYVGEVSYEFS